MTEANYLNNTKTASFTVVDAARVGPLTVALGDMGAREDGNVGAAAKLTLPAGCPADAAAEVKALADYVSPVSGGHGAARDVIEHILREEGIWESVVNSAYGAGI